MNPIDFIKQKVSQGASDIENWGDDVGHALSSVFSGPSQPNQSSAPTQTAPIKTAQSPVNVTNLAQQNAQTQAPAPFKLNLSSQQGQPAPAPTPTAPPVLNT